MAPHLQRTAFPFQGWDCRGLFLLEEAVGDK